MLTALEKRAMQFKHWVEAQDQSKTDLITTTVTSTDGMSSHSLSSRIDSKINQDQQDIQQLLRDKAGLLEVLGTLPGT